MELKSIELLNTSNYAIWSRKIRLVLKCNGLLPYIDKDHLYIKKLLLSTNGQEENEIAMRIISSRVGDEEYKKAIVNCKTAKEMWQTLKCEQLNLFQTILQEELSLINLIDSQSESEECSSEYYEQFFDSDFEQMKFEIRRLNEEIDKMYDEMKQVHDKFKPFKNCCQVCGQKKHILSRCPVISSINDKRVGLCVIS